MLALAGYPLGHRFRFFDSTPGPAAELAECVAGNYSDEAALDRFAAGLDVITYEFENVPVAAAEYLARDTPVYPPPRALAVSQDRLAEKKFLDDLGIPVAPFSEISEPVDLSRCIAAREFPILLKTTRGGYDGRGQVRVARSEQLAGAWEQINSERAVAEEIVPFQRELSIVSVRARSGSIDFYPLSENVHREGILDSSRVPAPTITHGLEERARSFATRILESLDYTGVLAIELFQTGNDLIVNEIAPRVHNSGHWSIEGAETSQFENHIRAVSGMPLGATSARGAVRMTNIVGTYPDIGELLKIPGAHVHLYGKSARPRRKLGHVTVLAADVNRADALHIAVRDVMGLSASQQQPELSSASAPSGGGVG